MGMKAGAVVLLVAASTSVQAHEAPLAPQDRGEADFLFGRPRGFLGLRTGLLRAAAQSDVYDFFTELLTIERGDFNSPLLGVDAGIRVASRADVLVGFEVATTSIGSEYRDFVEDNDLPIVQDTKLTVVPVTGGVKLYLAPRGREVSRYAFVPAAVVPYVGAGAGFAWYKLSQSGDFVDFVDLSIFNGTFVSSGFGLQAHAFGGVDVSLGTRWFLSFEGRYVWAEADLERDFVSFKPIDLSGLRITGGINVRF